MAPAQVALPRAHPQPLSQSLLQTTSQDQQLFEDTSIRTVDALLRHRASLNPHATIVSYPNSGVEFVDYSMQQLDVFAYRVARHYQALIPTRTSSDQPPTTVALLGPSNFEYLVTMLGLTKLGHTVLFLSTRISQLAIESLIQTTGATYLLADSRFIGLATDVSRNIPSLNIDYIAGSGIFDFPVEVHADTRMDYQLDSAIEENNLVYIIHSSGSTGLPKPIYQPHRSAIANYAVSMDMKAFITLPLYHNHGICNFFRAIYSGKSIHIYNADLPLTQTYLTTVLRKHEFEILYGVPYALKLLAETPEGIELLKQLKVVMYGGSACPDTLGDLLVDQGVNLVGHYGATEVGQLMTSFRPRNDKAWNYVRESTKLSPFLHWVPRGPKLYECTVLPGWPAKVASNQPDGSYATKDLFEPHPTIEKAWKYIARLDDTIVLLNGEKFNPVMMEGRIRSHKAVTETVIFGSGRPYVGALIVPSPSVYGLSSLQIVDEIWPVIEEANRTTEAYVRLSPDMIRILPHNCEFPRTDKGSIIRQAFYKAFEADISNAYDQVAAANGVLKSLTIPGLEALLRDILANILPLSKDAERTTDFFSIGLDSLQSLQVRNAILRTVNIGNSKLGQNVVFDYPSIASLSAHLHGLRTGASEVIDSVSSKMQNLIDRCSKFQPPSRGSVVLTGATGCLGAHVLAQLIARPDIETVYCLVRARDAKDAAYRVQKSLIQRKIYHSLSLTARRKIHALPSDLSSPHLGLDRKVYQAVAQKLTNIIHCAWSVNFNLTLSSFEKDCVLSVRHLIDLCLAAPSSNRASFDFCSSVSTVAKCPDLHAPESIAEIDWAQGMGYAQSKCVAEHICLAAGTAFGIKARVLRIGQIVADTTHGIWNETEAIPLIMQSALTIGALPKLQESPSWTPVDVVAQAITEIALSDEKINVANVTNKKTFSWVSDLLPALRQAGLEFDEVEPREWVKRLATSSDDAIANPPKKLLEFFASKYDKDTFPPSRTYETSVATSLSPALANAPVLNAGFVKTFVDHFRHNTWKYHSASKSVPKKHMIVVTGPCGSGKSTIAKQLSAEFNSPFIEGDELYSPETVPQMPNGTSLGNLNCTSWLDRLKEHALFNVTKVGHDKVFLACSALNQARRDKFRELGQNDSSVNVIFLDLQVEEEELLRRLGEREDHNVYADMVVSQLAIREEPGVVETDILPLDAGKPVLDMVDEICVLLDFAFKVGFKD